MLDAGRRMVAENLLLDRAQRRAHRGDLRDHVDAVAVLFDHTGKPANLPLDPLQALEHGSLGISLHPCYIPLPGISCNSKDDGAAMTSTTRADHKHASGHHDPHGAHHHGHAAADAVIDPVCGMTVDAHTTPHRHTYQGHTYHFCSAGCRTKFAADPPKYLGENKPTEPVPEGTIYTCPMHPEIRQVGPGSCPICGMALEPEVATAESGPNPELADMTRRLWIGLVLTIPVVVLEMGAHVVGAHRWIEQTLSNSIQLVFATPVVLWAGWPFFVRGWQSVVTRNLNMFTLIAMGTGVALVYSVIATLAPGLFPAAFRGHDGAVAVYFEAAAVITVLVLLGQVLELRARDRTSGAIRALLGLQPKTARRIGAHGDELSLKR